jgi:hypothetical protein
MFWVLVIVAVIALFYVLIEISMRLEADYIARKKEYKNHVNPSFKIKSWRRKYDD